LAVCAFPGKSYATIQAEPETTLAAYYYCLNHPQDENDQEFRNRVNWIHDQPVESAT
jgi:hypothetical protein